MKKPLFPRLHPVLTSFVLSPAARALAGATVFAIVAAGASVAKADWVAGRDMAAMEKPDGQSSNNGTNNKVPEWSYGYRATTPGRDLTLFAPANHLDNNFGSLDGWDRTDLKVQVNTGTTPTTLHYCCGSLKPLAPGAMLVHPGRDSARPVVRWTAPAAGSYSIAARWQDLDNHGGNGASGHVVINGLEVFGRMWPNDGAVTMLSQPFKLQKGDIVDFVVDPEGDIGYDSTGFDATVTDSPAPPPHGGLSATSFTVNENAQPSYPPVGSTVNGLADTVLRFTAQQIGTAGGLSVRAQATTTPTVESSWTDLPTPSHGRMTFDSSINRYVLNTTDYPHTQADPVYFRAIASAQGYSDSISNVVGPLNLTSNKSRVGAPQLSFAAMGPLADFYFRAATTNPPAGVTVRIQSSAAPEEESTWKDLRDASGHAVGGMTRSANNNFPNDFILLLDQLPASNGTYFRAVASAPGYVDGISSCVGPFSWVNDKPPVVALFPPEGLDGSGDGHDAAHRIILAAGNTNFAAVAHSGRTISKVQLKVDGETVTDYPGDPNQNTVYYAGFDATVGDHILEAVGFDDLGAHARAGTNATFVRVVSGAGSANANRTAPASGTAALSSVGIFHVVKDKGVWTDPKTWDQNRVPTAEDFVDLEDHEVWFGADGEVGSITINGGTLLGRAQLHVHHIMEIDANGCTIKGSLLIDLESGATCNLLNSNNVVFQTDPLVNQDNFTGTFFVLAGSTLNIHGNGSLVGAQKIYQEGLVNWLPPIDIPADARTNPAAGTRVLGAGTILGTGVVNGDYSKLIVNNGGAVISHDGGTLIGHDGGSLIGHDGGSLIGHDGGSLITTDGASVIAAGGGNVVGPGGASLVSTNGGNTIAQGGGNVIATGGGNVIAAGGGNLQRRAKAAADGASTGYVQNGGSFNLNAAFVLGPVTLDSGTLAGSGLIVGNVSNNGGFISPGDSSAAGMIVVSGNFSQAANGTVIIKRVGAGTGQFDQVQIGGFANLAGKLDVKTMNGYTPSPSDTFDPLGYQSATGSLSVSSNAQITVNPTGVVVSADPSKPNPVTGQPLNISTRMQVLAGDNVLIAGFIVMGPAGSTKKVLIRGLGPSLANVGVPGTLSDPLLELHKPGGSVVSNDNWQEDDTGQIPSGFAPGDRSESLIVATLSPGNYSAVLKGAHGESGVGIAEVYDLESGSAAQLANISSRGFVNTGDNVMIGGFIVGGSEPTQVLVRAIGPSLSAVGVQGALPATTLELHDANGAALSNEGWRNIQEADIAATGIPPSNDKEAAILATLVPGNYTAVVRGKDGTTGIGLVEAYNLQ